MLSQAIAVGRSIRLAEGDEQPERAGLPRAAIRCTSCRHATPTPARFCRACGSPLAEISERTAALVRTRRRAFAAAARAFAPYLRKAGIHVDPYWEEIFRELSDAALVHHDEQVLRAWYGASGRDFDGERRAARAFGDAKLAQMLRRDRGRPRDGRVTSHRGPVPGGDSSGQRLNAVSSMTPSEARSM